MQNQRGWRLAILAYQSIGVVSVYASRFFNPSMLPLNLPLGHELTSVMCANDQFLRHVYTICKAVLTCCRCTVDLVRTQSFLFDAASFMTILCLSTLKKFSRSIHLAPSTVQQPSWL